MNVREWSGEETNPTFATLFEIAGKNDKLQLPKGCG